MASTMATATIKRLRVSESSRIMEPVVWNTSNSCVDKECIRCMTSAPAHSALNGLVERGTKTSRRA